MILTANPHVSLALTAVECLALPFTPACAFCQDIKLPHIPGSRTIAVDFQGDTEMTAFDQENLGCVHN